MIDTLRRCGSLLAVVVLVCISTAWADPGSDATQDPAYRIAFKFKPGDVSYYIVENEYDDSGAIVSNAFPLSYGTTLRERRTIIQRVLEPTTRPAVTDETKDWANLVWEHDRYEVRERPPMSSEDVYFDSHRHLYPPPSQRELGTIPGSSVGFRMDPNTGKVQHVRIQPARVEGPATRKKLSSTGEKCRLTKENVERLLCDIGEYYFPPSPQRVGDSWTLTHREPIKGEQTLVTNLMCTLRSVQEKDGRQIATIDLMGDVRLEGGEQEKPATTSAPTSAPAEDSKVSATSQPTTDGAEASGEATEAASEGTPAATSESKPDADEAPTNPESNAMRRALPSDARAFASMMGTPFSASPSANGDLSSRWTQRAPKPSAKKPATTRPTSQPKNGKGVMRPGSKQQPKDRKSPRHTRRGKRSSGTTTPRRTTAVRTKPDFTLKSAVCSGNVQFDLTNGQLIELYLRRETNLSATLKSEKPTLGATTIRQGSTQVLRVRVMDSPPRKPVIVGGKTPPVIPDQDKPNAPGVKKPPVKPAAGQSSAGEKKDDDLSEKPRSPHAGPRPIPRNRPTAETPATTQPASEKPQEKVDAES